MLGQHQMHTHNQHCNTSFSNIYLLQKGGLKICCREYVCLQTSTSIVAFFKSAEVTFPRPLGVVGVLVFKQVLP